LDDGSTWIRSFHFDDVRPPWDVIHYEEVTGIPPGTRSVLFKFVLHTTNTEAAGATGLYSVRMEANYQPVNGRNSPVEVTVKWHEVQADRSLVERSHKQLVTTFPLTYDIDVGGADHPIMDSLTVNLAGSGDGTPYGYSDGTDAGGTKYLYRWRTDGVNLAVGRPYGFSRPPGSFQGSAGAEHTTILTDGVVGAPATGGISYLFGQCWYPGSDLDITVDLGQPQPVGAFRSHLFGWPAWDALKGEVQDRVELLTSTDQSSFQSQGTLDLSLRKKDLPINYMLMEDEYASAWNFELTLDAPVRARYVRFHITPSPDRIVCSSELQIFDRVDYRPFDIGVALPGTP
jgi:hypothetical protein